MGPGIVQVPSSPEYPLVQLARFFTDFLPEFGAVCQSGYECVALVVSAFCLFIGVEKSATCTGELCC